MEEKLYTFKELLELYQVDSKTLLVWVRSYHFPLLTITPYKRYAREDDIRHWESNFGTRCYQTGSMTDKTSD
jgi:predicted site-specific integrase-resolvase